VLAAQVRDKQQAIERCLLFLHEQRVIILQKGLAVFRQAMTIRVLPENRGRRFLKNDFEPLAQHYGQRVLQVHVMDHYARLGLTRIREALQLVLAYFSMDRREFIQRFFPREKAMLERATTADSYQKIVESLGNTVQQAIVTAGPEENLLILAGPGSGKTRTVVHRCAYLLRVERVPPASILVLCFNRHAAMDARRRLMALVGPDARFVTVQTYHGLAMRLAGASLADQPDRTVVNFDAVLDRAIHLLRGEVDLPGMGEDELRDRLLAGYRHILVDEYQDIDEKQYELVSAIAGRTLTDDDSKLTILAVGDDDQNIYAFRGANVAYIRRFQKDYRARDCHLLENYRSSDHIIGVSNALIFQNRDRMKTQHPIRIDPGRASQPPGGKWETIDPVARGRVQILEVADLAVQAPAVIDELGRLRDLGRFDWSDCAVLSSTHDELATVRTLCEQRGIPARVSLTCDGSLPLARVREIDRILEHLRERHGSLVRASGIRRLLPADDQCHHWHKLVLGLLDQWQVTTEDTEQPAIELADYFYSALIEERREHRFGQGLLLGTVHGAKGLEFDHVVILGGRWSPKHGETEELRRLFYVGMTRARHTLALVKRTDAHHRLIDDLRHEESSLVHRAIQTATPLTAELLRRRYTILGYRDVHLDFAGRRNPRDRVHAELARLNHGDVLLMKSYADGVGLFAKNGTRVCALSQSAAAEWRDRLEAIESVRLLAVCVRRREDVEASDFRQQLKADTWEIPVVEIVHR
jgi:ATP-dependent DNA helicase RecQ